MSRMRAFVASSQIRNGGAGLFVDAGGDDTMHVSTGQVLAWYVGELVDPAGYFALDAARDHRVDYAHGVAGTSWAVVPKGAALGDRDALVADAVPSNGGPCPREQPAIGHFANDRFCVTVDTRSPDPRADLENSIKAYQERRNPPSGRFAEVSIDWEWQNAEPPIDQLPPATVVAFPVVATQPFTIAPSSSADDRNPVELFLSYGVNYWVSRCISPLFWLNEHDDDRPLARRLHAKAVETLGTDARISPLPPRFRLAAAPSAPAEVVTQQETAPSKPALRLVHEATGEPLSAMETRMAAMAVLGRDAAILRMPIKVLTLLIVRGMIASH